MQWQSGKRICRGLLSLVIIFSILGATVPTSAHSNDRSCTMPAKIEITKLAAHIFYPVITGGVADPKIQKQINRTFLQHAQAIQNLDRKYKKQYERDRLISAAGPYYALTQPSIRYNQRCRLSVSFVDESYTGGAHGMHLETVYNYNLRDGKRYRLQDVIKNKTEEDKVNNYLKKQMTELKAQGRYDFFLDSFKGVNMKDGQFYFYDQGIVIVFQEYEVAPYSNGIIHLKVPYSVFKTPRHHHRCADAARRGCSEQPKSNQAQHQ